MNIDNPQAPMYAPVFLILGGMPAKVQQSAMSVSHDSAEYMAAFQEWIRDAHAAPPPTLYRCQSVPTAVTLYAEVYNLQPGSLTYRMEIEDPSAPIEEAFLWAESCDWYANENGASAIAHGSSCIWFPRAGRYKVSLYIDNQLARTGIVNVTDINPDEAIRRSLRSGFNPDPTQS